MSMLSSFNAYRRDDHHLESAHTGAKLGDVHNRKAGHVGHFGPPPAAPTPTGEAAEILHALTDAADRAAAQTAVLRTLLDESSTAVNFVRDGINKLGEAGPLAQQALDATENLRRLAAVLKEGRTTAERMEAIAARVDSLENHLQARTDAALTAQQERLAEGLEQMAQLIERVRAKADQVGAAAGERCARRVEASVREALSAVSDAASAAERAMTRTHQRCSEIIELARSQTASARAAAEENINALAGRLDAACTGARELISRAESVADTLRSHSAQASDAAEASNAAAAQAAAAGESVKALSLRCQNASAASRGELDATMRDLSAWKQAIAAEHAKADEAAGHALHVFEQSAARLDDLTARIRQGTERAEHVRAEMERVNAETKASLAELRNHAAMFTADSMARMEQRHAAAETLLGRIEGTLRHADVRVEEALAQTDALRPLVGQIAELLTRAEAMKEGLERAVTKAALTLTGDRKDAQGGRPPHANAA